MSMSPEPDRPTAALATSRFIAHALLAFAVGIATFVIAALTTGHPSKLWQPLVLGTGPFCAVGATLFLRFSSMLRRLEPKSIPLGWSVEQSIPGNVALSLRSRRERVVLLFIGLAFALSGAGQAMYLAAILLGVAPWALASAATLRRWERQHALRLAVEVAPGPTLGNRSVWFAMPPGSRGRVDATGLDQ
jgi:hypothetical protein